GAGTGQMLNFLDSTLFVPYRLTFTDLSRRFLDRLEQRLARSALTAQILEDDIEDSAIEAGADLLIATLLLEHIEWRRGVDAIAVLRPLSCGVILQDNPPGMTAAVTPGRRIPASMAVAMVKARPQIVPR